MFEQNLIKNATWAISNLARGKPHPTFEDIGRVGLLSHNIHIDCVFKALPTLFKLLQCSDDELIADALWAVSYLSDGDEIKVQVIIDLNFVQLIATLLHHSSPSVLVRLC